MVQAQLDLIQEVQTDVWWQDVTVPLLETARRRLRALVQFIDRQQRKPVYTDFEDSLGDEADVNLPGFAAGTDLARFRDKARAFLRAHLDHVAIQKLRRNRPLTVSDLVELERMLAESGLGGPEEISRAAEESHGLGLFVRSLVGLDRAAAKEALAAFIAGKTLSGNQLTFLDMVVDHLTEHGVLEAARLYESPFTDISARGPDGVFESAQVDALLAVIEQMHRNACAA